MRKSLRFEGVLVALVSVAVGTSSCKPAEEQAAINDQQNEAEQLPLPALPTVEPPLNRAAVLSAVEKAASAAALGRDDREAQAKLDGKRIEVRIRFGCPAVSSNVPDAPFEVRFDEKDRTLRLRASPDLGLKDVQPAPKAGDDIVIDQVEGFWIRRPWLLEAACPVASSTAAEQTAQRAESSDVKAAAQREQKPAKATAKEASESEAVQLEMAPSPHIGIAQYFTKQDSRLAQRDGRPYETTKTLPEGEKPSGTGYDLVLGGRMRALPGGKVIDCRVSSVDRAPICIVFTQLDSVRMEQPETRALLAEWSRQ